ncbi:MAG TPA: hypothetical protein VGH45_01110 [Solirubrobacteraceae bacterium]|jgi:GH15 family glucan-1,4-alpha-glucosidase
MNEPALVGFLPGDDERMAGTIDAISLELGRDGFISRCCTAETDAEPSGARPRRRS